MSGSRKRVISRDEIASACRYADAIVEERQDFLGYWRERGVDALDLAYVAEQRALKVGMVMAGMNPNVVKPTPVHLPRAIQSLLPSFAAAFVDGFSAGMSVRDITEGP